MSDECAATVHGEHLAGDEISGGEIGDGVRNSSPVPVRCAGARLM